MQIFEMCPFLLYYIQGRFFIFELRCNHMLIQTKVFYEYDGQDFFQIGFLKECGNSAKKK